MALLITVYETMWITNKCVCIDKTGNSPMSKVWNFTLKLDTWKKGIIFILYVKRVSCCVAACDDDDVCW
jgi:hypothetical protein